jgi:arylsulfatase
MLTHLELARTIFSPGNRNAVRAWRMRIVLCSFAILGFLGCGEPPPDSRPANVLLILIDTLRADHLSIYGYERATSPRIDAFGEANLVFEDVRSQAACTSPSVSSLLTSRSPLTLLDQPKGHMGIPREIPSFAEILQAKGYWTVAVSASPIVRKSPSEANRFGEFDRGFGLFHEDCLVDDASCVNEAALQLLSVVTEPFFMYLHYMDVHGPYLPPPDFERPFSKEIHQPQFLREGRAEQLQLVAKRGGVAVSPEEIDHLKDLYDDEIAYLDLHIGKLLDALEERKLSKNTIVVIASDHGEAFGERGYLGHCRVPIFEAMVQTPLIMRIPGVHRPGPIKSQAQNIDIVPTILDYLGLTSLDLDLEGRSLRAAIEEDAVVNPYVFTTQGVEVAVSNRDQTLTLNVENGETRLFDRQADPEHDQNLATGATNGWEPLRSQVDQWLSSKPGTPKGEAIARNARRLEDELRALGYIQTSIETVPDGADEPSGR